MTNPNHTLIGILVDRSGSMEDCRNDMQGGLNTFITEQAKEPGSCDVTIAQFDTVYERVLEPTPIAEVKPYALHPRGATALLDGMGKFITETGEYLEAIEESERPGTVIIVIVTDGEENSSQEWKDPAKIKARVQRQTNDYGWRFIFLGANMDAVKTAASYGIGRGSTMTYDSRSTVGVANTYSSLSASVVNIRSGLADSFTDDDRKGAVSPSTP